MVKQGKSPSHELEEIESTLEDLLKSGDNLESFKSELGAAVKKLSQVRQSVKALEIDVYREKCALQSSESVGRELHRTTKPLPAPGEKGPHHIDC